MKDRLCQLVFAMLMKTLEFSKQSLVQTMVESNVLVNSDLFLVSVIAF